MQIAVEPRCSDEARFGLQPVLRRVWAPRGERPLAHVAPDYEWLWLYAAAHPRSGENFWLSLPRLDSEMVQRFLDEFAQTDAPAGKQVILVWDGAPAHRAKSLQVPERITIVRLPAYTSELNPAEHLWPLIKEGVANEPFKDLAALERRVSRRVRRISEDQEHTGLEAQLSLVAEWLIHLILFCNSVLAMRAGLSAKSKLFTAASMQKTVVCVA